MGNKVIRSLRKPCPVLWKYFFSNTSSRYSDCDQVYISALTHIVGWKYFFYQRSQQLTKLRRLQILSVRGILSTSKLAQQSLRTVTASVPRRAAPWAAPRRAPPLPAATQLPPQHPPVLSHSQAHPRRGPMTTVSVRWDGPGDRIIWGLSVERKVLTSSQDTATLEIPVSLTETLEPQPRDGRAGQGATLSDSLLPNVPWWLSTVLLFCFVTHFLFFFQLL